MMLPTWSMQQSRDPADKNRADMENAGPRRGDSRDFGMTHAICGAAIIFRLAVEVA